MTRYVYMTKHTKVEYVEHMLFLLADYDWYWLMRPWRWRRQITAMKLMEGGAVNLDEAARKRWMI